MKQLIYSAIARRREDEADTEPTPRERALCCKVWSLRGDTLADTPPPSLAASSNGKKCMARFRRRRIVLLYKMRSA